MILILKTVLALIFIVVFYFLLVTRVSLIFNSLSKKEDSASHIYWIYSNRFLIWLTDRHIIISAILFFNYKRLTDAVLQQMNPSMKGKRVLQASCAFGDISQKIAEKCHREGAGKFVIFDLIPNEIRHAQKKSDKDLIGQKCFYLLEDAVNIAHKNESFDYVIIFFLFHELPLEKKVASLKESVRVLKPGGKLIFAEFHRPGPWILRLSGRCFFKIFEPFAKEMWGRFDPVKLLDEETHHQWEYTKKNFFYGNYQVFTAKKTKVIKPLTC